MILEDKISALSDDILVTILSLLTVKEAVATSIRRRWRYLWTSLHTLNFTYKEILKRNNYNEDDEGGLKIFVANNRDRYIQVVTQVLRLHTGPKLRELGIHYPLNSRSGSHIDLWVAFVIALKVSKLELNFSPNPLLIWVYDTNNYSIPLAFLNITKGIEPYLVRLDHVFSIRTLPLNVDNRFECLKELDLKFVDLTDEQLETVLSTCTSLERLHLLYSRKLMNVKHIVPHMKLNCLEIYHCAYLENIEIFAPNLVSFKYLGPRIYIFVKDAKQVINVCMYPWGFEQYRVMNSLGLPLLKSKLIFWFWPIC